MSFVLPNQCNICGENWPNHWEYCAYAGNIRDLQEARAKIEQLEHELSVSRSANRNSSYVEAVDPLCEDDNLSIFLAGGITDCPDWQAEATVILLDEYSDMRLRVLNPRRADFPIDNPNAAQEQIRWEFDALKMADAILFWFPEGAIQPIALFELGRWSWVNKSIAVGADPNYVRRQDVKIQMDLCSIQVYDTLDHTVETLIDQLCYL